MPPRISLVSKQAIQQVVADSSIPWSQFNSKTVLITGATGLIGGLITRILVEAGSQFDLNIKVIAATRNNNKARHKFRDIISNSNFSIIETNLFSELGQLKNLSPVHYIIHCANETQSKAFVDTPVDVISSTFQYSLNILEFSRHVSIESIVFLSTLEVYGVFSTHRLINENTFAPLDPSSIRSSYPESKRICETLCVGHHAQHGTPVKIARLTQTFGPGITWDDNRVFAEFARNICEGKNITLLTDGATRRDYLYVTDAASAILTLLTRGSNGQAYNISNNEANRSIRELANAFARHSPNQTSSVLQHSNADASANRGFADHNEITLNTSKIEALGWHPAVSFDEMINLFLKYFKEISA